MEKDENRTNLIIIIFLVLVMIGAFIFSITHHISTKNKQSKQEEVETEEDIDNNDNIPNIEENNRTFYKGDSVILTDSSSWHVIENSLDSDNYVILLKDQSINENINYNEINQYLKKQYLNLLIDSLNAEINDILDIRLLTLNDISNIIKIQDIEIGDSLESSNLYWLYNSENLINDISSNSLPILICPNDGINLARICEGSSNIYPFKPVIKINKKYIK